MHSKKIRVGWVGGDKLVCYGWDTQRNCIALRRWERQLVADHMGVR